MSTPSRQNRTMVRFQDNRGQNATYAPVSRGAHLCRDYAMTAPACLPWRCRGPLSKANTMPGPTEPHMAPARWYHPAGIDAPDPDRPKATGSKPRGLTQLRNFQRISQMDKHPIQQQQERDAKKTLSALQKAKIRLPGFDYSLADSRLIDKSDSLHSGPTVSPAGRTTPP